VLEFDTEDVPWKWVVVGKLEGQGVEGGNEERGTESYVGVAAVFSRDFLVCGPKLLGSGLLRPENSPPPGPGPCPLAAKCHSRNGRAEPRVGFSPLKLRTAMTPASLGLSHGWLVLLYSFTLVEMSWNKSTRVCQPASPCFPK
jgi:hypothetical protein